MNSVILTVIIFAFLLALIFFGVPIVFSLGFLSLVLASIFWGIDGLYIFATSAYGQIASFSLIAIPLFILMAEIILQAEISAKLYDSLAKWIGWVPGGLAVSSVIASAMFGAVCGASSATAATIGKIAVPEMLKRNYNERLACGAVAAAGALGSLIPPSIYMILYGTSTETSIGKLFIGGIVPGLLIAFTFSVYIVIKCKLNPQMAPSIVGGFSWRERWNAFLSIWEVIILAVAMFVALYRGIASPSEIAGIGAFAAFVIVLARRQLTWKNIRRALIGTCTTTCFIGWILVSASAFGYVLSYLQIPQELSMWMVSLPVSRYVVLAGIHIIWIILGCIMDPAAIILITVPIFAPVAKELGFDLVWFGVAMVINTLVAQITPPLGLNLFIVRNIAPPSVSLKDIVVGSLPFMLLELLALALITIWPQIILWLPSKMLG